MRYLFLTGVILCLAVTSAQAADVSLTATLTIDSIMFKGDIIDNISAGSKGTAELEDSVKTYSKEIALQPDCVKSGYSIFCEGKLYKFDAASNAKIEEFLKKPDSSLQVTAMVKKRNGELSLVSIENREQ